jgi:hypothetical protein
MFQMNILDPSTGLKGKPSKAIAPASVGFLHDSLFGLETPGFL